MKKILPILNFLLLLCLVACVDRTNVALLLGEAEKCMNEKPDSALLLLESVTRPEELSKEQNALWCLLITQARDKEYVKQTSDSLINIAVHYFDKSGHIDRRVQAYYCQGRVLTDMMLFDKAIISYLKAEELIQQTTDYNLQARVYNQLGDLYSENFFYKEALHYYQRANISYNLEKFQLGNAYSLRDIGLAYENLGSLDSALFYLNTSWEISERNGWSNLSRTVLVGLASVYEGLSLYQEAIKSLHQSILVTQDESLLYSSYYSLGSLFRKIGQADSAFYYLDKVANSSNLHIQCQQNREYSILLYNQKDYEAAFEHNDQYILLRDSIEHVYQPQRLAEVEALYNYEKLINDKNQLIIKRKNTMLLSSSLIMALMVAITIIYIIYKNKLSQKQLIIKDKELALLDGKQKLKESQYEFEINRVLLIGKENELKLILKELEDKEKSVKLLKQETQQFINECSTEKDALSQQIAVLRNEIDREKNLIKSVRSKYKIFLRKYLEDNHPQMAKLYDKKEVVNKYTDKEWKDFEKIFNSVYPTFVKKLCKSYPLLSKKEQRYCCLLLLGVKTAKISAILGLEPNTISKYSREILKKHIVSNGDQSLEDILDSMV